MMQPAVAPQEDPRLLVLDPQAARWKDTRMRDLADHVREGDLLVLNDAATLPASLAARTGSGDETEVRLLARRPDGRWRAVLLGAGDWRIPTENRPAPPRVAIGEPLLFHDRFLAIVTEVSSLSPRLVTVKFESTAFWRELYRHARPVQYSYLRDALELWDVQTPYASRPWAVEAPSAGRPLRWPLLAEVKARGGRLATLTHAAGLSSTGDPAIDAALPFPEAYEVPRETAEAVSATKGRVIAVGTTVVRALESWAATGILAGETDLRIGPETKLRAVDGLLTGLHEPHASHFGLLQAFAPRPFLERAYAHAESAGYLWHELGDSNLILPGAGI